MYLVGVADRLSTNIPDSVYTHGRSPGFRHNSIRVHWLLLLQVLARHVNPEQMLEVVHLNEVLAEAQRGAAAADAAVAAVDKVGAARVAEGRWVGCHACMCYGLGVCWCDSCVHKCLYKAVPG
jgi:hypothetical protein